VRELRCEPHKEWLLGVFVDELEDGIHGLPHDADPLFAPHFPAGSGHTVREAGIFEVSLLEFSALEAHVASLGKKGWQSLEYVTQRCLRYGLGSLTDALLFESLELQRVETGEQRSQ